MKLEIDATLLSVVLVLVVLGSALYITDIRIIALSSLALLVLFLMTKVIYFETSVFIVMLVLVILAIFGDKLAEFVKEGIGEDWKAYNPRDQEDPFVKAVMLAYSEQYAPFGKIISVDPNYCNKLFDRANIAENEFKRFSIIPDDRLIIFLGGVETIEDIRVGSDKPFDAKMQVSELVRDRRIWVKVRVKDPRSLQIRDDIWVKVKAYVGKIPIKEYYPFSDDDADGAVWDQPITIFDNWSLFHAVGIMRAYIIEGNVQLVDLEASSFANPTIIANKIDKHDHYWSYDIAEV